MRRHLGIRGLALALVLCLVCGALGGCGKADLPAPQPGVTYTELFEAMNRQLDTTLSDSLGEGYWWGAIDSHLLAYGLSPRQPGRPDAEREHLLLTVDPENSTCTQVTLALPQVTAATPELQKALAAAEGGAVPDREDPDGYDEASRRVIGVWAAAQGGDGAADQAAADGQASGTDAQADTAIDAASGQLYLLLQDQLTHHAQDANGDWQWQNRELAMTLCNLGEGGQLQPLAVLDLPENARQSLFYGCTPDGAGGVWLAAFGWTDHLCQLLRFSVTDGSLLAALPLPDALSFASQQLLLLEDGRLAVLANTAASEVALYLAKDLTSETPNWEDPLPLPQTLAGESVFGFVPDLRGAGKTLLINTRKAVYKYDLDSGECQKQLQWIDYDVEGNQMFAAFDLEDGRYLAVCRGWEEGDPYRLHLLTPLNPKAVAGRSLLTLALENVSFDSEKLLSVINTFNANSDEYFVQVVPYTYEAAQAAGYDHGFQMLQEDVLAGKVPDITISSSLADTMGDKGLWIDLAPYFEADPELSKEDFVPGIIDSCYQDGVMSGVVPVFDIEPVIGKTSLVGETPGWTIEEFLDLCEAHPNSQLVYQKDAVDVLFDLTCMPGSPFIDRETHKAFFDTPEYVRLLELLAKAPYEEPTPLQWPSITGESFPSEPNPRPYMEGERTLLYTQYPMQGVWSVNEYRYILQEDFCYKGLPTRDGRPGIYASPALLLGITSSCKHPEGAWQVIRQFLLPAFQNDANKYSFYYFPARLESLQKRIQRCDTYELLKDGGGDPSYISIEAGLYNEDHINPAGTGYAFDKDELEPLYADFHQGLSQQEIDKLYQMFANLYGIASYNFAIRDIVLEEADEFFGGVRTAEEAAAITQNRVQTYLDEQS